MPYRNQLKNKAAPPHDGFYHAGRAKIRTLTDKFLFEEWLQDPELARRARLITNLGLLGFLFGGFYAIFYLAIGHYWGAGIIVICSVAFIVTPFLMRATRSLAFAGNLLPGIMLAGFTALCCVEGGLSGHAIAWMVGVPLWALLLAGKTSAKWWALVCLLTVGGLVVLAEAEVNFPRTYNLRWDTVIFGMGYLGLIVFMFVIGILFENGREQALDQLHKALDKLEESNRQLVNLNNEKNEFLGIAAHDLKNPLTTIILSAEMLKQGRDPTQTSRLSDGIVRSGTRMRDLITNLLDANAIEQGSFTSNIQRCDLNTLIAQSVEHNQANATRKEIALVIVAAGEAWARVDGNATLQIIDNLISNAIKYSPQKTMVRIRTFAEAGRLGVAIQDEGPGISGEDRKKMFGKFTRLSAKPTGGESSSGLGLSIVKRLAEAMAGTVECQSDLGAGSTFIVRLPAWDETQPDPARETAAAALSPVPPAPADTLEAGRLRIVLATIFINIISVAWLVFVPWSDWKTGVALNLVDNFLLLSFVLWRRDGLLARFMLFGLAVGFAELAADAWLVGHTRTLDYAIGGGPMLWRSPAWMPFAWEIVTVQFGYLGLRLWERLRGWGLLAIGVLGAINIPYYEEMARRINWWQYHGCRMISFTPYYIILGEFGIAILLAILARQLRCGNWRTALFAGLAGGAGIFICYAIAFWLTDGFVRQP